VKGWVKVTFQITRALHKRLKIESESSGESMATIMRQAIRRGLQPIESSWEAVKDEHEPN